MLCIWLIGTTHITNTPSCLSPLPFAPTVSVTSLQFLLAYQNQLLKLLSSPAPPWRAMAKKSERKNVIVCINSQCWHMTYTAILLCQGFLIHNVMQCIAFTFVDWCGRVANSAKIGKNGLIINVGGQINDHSDQLEAILANSTTIELLGGNLPKTGICNFRAHVHFMQ